VAEEQRVQVVGKIPPIHTLVFLPERDKIDEKALAQVE
jgi:hypothetical protein